MRTVEREGRIRDEEHLQHLKVLRRLSKAYRSRMTTVLQPIAVATVTTRSEGHLDLTSYGHA